MREADLVVRGGTVIDGTGLPARQADIAIRDGRIVSIGLVESRGHREIDATDLVVAPGFVDAHTHYDPQFTFEPYATSSCFHGVTTVVTGNCGFSVAPVRPGDGAWVRQLFARVEGMDPAALSGIPFDDFESFADFLRFVEPRLGLNAAFYVGHCAVRRYVLGDDAQTREATDGEIDAMAEIVFDAVTAGALGLSSTHSPTHWDSADRPAPSRCASNDELLALVRAAGRAGGGSVGYLPRSIVGGLSDSDAQLLIDMSLAGRIAVITQGLGARSKVDAPTSSWESAHRLLTEATGRGASIYSMAMSRPFNRVLSFVGGTRVFEGTPGFDALFDPARTREERVAMLRDPAFRDRARASLDAPNQDPAAGPVLPPPKWSDLIVERSPARSTDVGLSLADLGAARGTHPFDALADLAVSTDLDFELMWRTENPEWIERTRDVQRDPHILVGTSDAGAHLDRDDGAEASSYFLRYWVREWGAFSLEEGIRQLTSVPAAACGLTGRGTLAPGGSADLAIFDADTIGPGEKYVAHDFPNGAARWVSRPVGVKATIVNGIPVVVDGQLATDERPGQLVRRGQH